MPRPDDHHLTEPQRQALVALIDGRPGASLGEIAAAFRDATGRAISTASVCRARKVGYAERASRPCSPS